MKRLLVACMSIAVTACALSPNKTLNLPTELSALSNTTALACHYEKQVYAAGQPTSPVTDWYFWRDGKRTETHDEITQQGEIWERDQQGRLTHTQIFFDEKVTLEYTNVDLVTSGISPQWQQLWSLIDPKTLGKELKRERVDTVAGLGSEHYSGQLDGMTTELDWLPNLQLPARIEKKTDRGGFSLKLTACHAAEQSPWKPLSKPAYDQYRHLEYTDLGDMESDPLVLRILARLGGHTHAHGDH